MKNILKGISLMIVVIIFASIAIGSNVIKYNGSVTINGTTMSTKEFAKEFENNEVVAQEKYKEQDLIVVDKIESINDSTYLSGYLVDSYIKTENGFFVETSGLDLSGFSVGDVITIKGNLFNNFKASSFDIYKVNGHTVEISH